MDHDTASLIDSLAHADRLPRSVTAAPDVPEALARLVLDGILQIRHGGTFRSGPRAVGALFRTVPDHRAAGRPNRLARLTDSALEHGMALGLTEPAVLALRLYGFNTEPATPRWCRRLPDQEAVAGFLGLGHGGKLADEIDRAGGDTATGRSSWRNWRTRETDGAPPGRPTYKLYLSPGTDHLPCCLESVTALLEGEHRPFAFKVGRRLYDILRPDKLVLYFTTSEAVRRAAALLAAELTGVPAAGVPFTAPLSESGLVSWGIDPPTGESLASWNPDRSWRRWLINRSATALVSAAERPEAGVNPIAFVLARVSLEGVDPATWAPRDGLWEGGTEDRHASPSPAGR